MNKVVFQTMLIKNLIYHYNILHIYNELINYEEKKLCMNVSHSHQLLTDNDISKIRINIKDKSFCWMILEENKN